MPRRSLVPPLLALSVLLVADFNGIFAANRFANDGSQEGLLEESSHHLVRRDIRNVWFLNFKDVALELLQWVPRPSVSPLENRDHSIQLVCRTVGSIINATGSVCAPGGDLLDDEAKCLCSTVKFINDTIKSCESQAESVLKRITRELPGKVTGNSGNILIPADFDGITDLIKFLDKLSKTPSNNAVDVQGISDLIKFIDKVSKTPSNYEFLTAPGLSNIIQNIIEKSSNSSSKVSEDLIDVVSIELLDYIDAANKKNKKKDEEKIRSFDSLLLEIKRKATVLIQKYTRTKWRVSDNICVAGLYIQELMKGVCDVYGCIKEEMRCICESGRKLGESLRIEGGCGPFTPMEPREPPHPKPGHPGEPGEPGDTGEPSDPQPNHG